MRAKSTQQIGTDAAFENEAASQQLDQLLNEQA